MAISSHPSYFNSPSRSRSSSASRQLSPVTTFIQASPTTSKPSNLGQNSQGLLHPDGYTGVLELAEEPFAPLSKRETLFRLIGGFDGRDKMLSLLQPILLLLHHLLTTSPLTPLPRLLFTLLLRPKTRSLAVKRLYLSSESISNLKKLLTISAFVLEFIVDSGKDADAIPKLERMKKEELRQDESGKGEEMLKLQELSLERSRVDEESKEIPHLSSSYDEDRSSSPTSKSKSGQSYSYHHRTFLSTVMSIFFILPSSKSSIFPSSPHAFLQLFSSTINVMADSLDLFSFLGGSGIAWQLNSRRRKGIQRLAVWFALIGGLTEFLLMRNELRQKRRKVRESYERVAEAIDLDAERENEMENGEVDYDGCGPPGRAFTTSSSSSNSSSTVASSTSNLRITTPQRQSSSSVSNPSTSAQHQSKLPAAESILQTSRLSLSYTRLKNRSLIADLLFNTYEALMPKREKEGTEAFLGVIGGAFGLRAEWLKERWGVDEDEED